MKKQENQQGSIQQTINIYLYFLGTPRYRLTVKEIVDKALKEAELYQENKVDGLIVENMHDIPYQHTSKVGPEITACMAVICHQIKKIFKAGPVGVQILAGANTQALAVAKAAGGIWIS